MIGLLLNIIFVPLNLLAMLIFPPLKFIIRFFLRNTYLIIVIAAIAFLFSRCEKSETPRELTPASVTPGEQPQITSKQQILVEPVLKRENGDSAFATDLYATMTDPERAFYSKLFYWLLAKQPSGQTYEWDAENIAGAFTPTDTFQNKLGNTCRHFRERLKVHTIEQNLTGIACQQPNGSWCKLKANATPACGLGRKPGMLDSIKGLF